MVIQAYLEFYERNPLYTSVALLTLKANRNFTRSVAYEAVRGASRPIVEAFREGVEAEFFDADDPAELAEKVRGLLADDTLRRAVRDAGMRAVDQGGHTYRDRLDRIFELYESVGREARQGRSAVG